MSKNEFPFESVEDFDVDNMDGAELLRYLARANRSLFAVITHKEDGLITRVSRLEEKLTIAEQLAVNEGRWREELRKRQDRHLTIVGVLLAALTVIVQWYVARYYGTELAESTKIYKHEAVFFKHQKTTGYDFDYLKYKKNGRNT